jgi:tubulin monoglycylase TTLL3/8
MYSPTFEIYGLDFMLDENLDPFLIEFNTNPCFEMTCPILSNVIGSLLNNVFRYIDCSHNSRLVIDPLFPMVNLNPSKIKRLS